MTKGKALAILSDVLDVYAETIDDDKLIKLAEKMEQYIKVNLK